MSFKNIKNNVHKYLEYFFFVFRKKRKVPWRCVTQVKDRNIYRTIAGFITSIKLFDDAVGNRFF